MTVFPIAVAIKELMVDVPVMFKVPVVPSPLVKVPAPVKAVLTVRIPEFVYVPVIAAFGIEIVLVPLIVFVAPVKECAPVKAVNVVPLC